MPRTVDGVGGVGPSRNSRSVYETGVNCEDDENCLLKVKVVDSLYREKKVGAPGSEPPATRPPTPQPTATRSRLPVLPATEALPSVASESQVQSKKGAKRKKHGEQKQQGWKKKIHCTTTCEGEEQETISMYLRKADTVINVSIKSPAKRTKASSRQSKAIDYEESTEPSKKSTQQCTGSSGTQREMHQTCRSRREEQEGVWGLQQNIEDSARTVLVGSSGKPNRGAEVSRRCLQKSLEAEPLREVKEAIPSSSDAGKGFTFPDVGGTNEEEEAATFLPAAGGKINKAVKEVRALPSVEVREVQHQMKGTAEQGTTRSEEPSLNQYAQSRSAGEIPITNVSSQPASIIVGTQEDNSTQAMDEEQRAKNMIVGELPTNGTSLPTAEANQGDTNDAGTSNMDGVCTNPGAPSTTAVPNPNTAAVYPKTGVTSPEVTRPKKPCQITVAACLAEYRTARSRSPSPMPPSPPQGTPPSRPPRPTGPRGNSSPTTLRLVPHRTEVSPSTAEHTGGRTSEDPKMNLEAILSKLTPQEQAKYLRAKAELLEEKLGATTVEDGLTGSRQKIDKAASKQKGKTVMANSPPVTPEPTKKELRRLKKAAKKQAQMESIEKAMRELEQKRALLEGEGRKKSRVQVPSPRESGKGQHSKRPMQTLEVSEGLKVSQTKVGKKRKLDSVDSSGRSLPSESNVVNDLHSIGMWDSVKDVPPCEVNAEGAPIGRFWKHMQSYTHDRAPWLFAWDIPWTQQDKGLKRAFANRVQSLYPGKYDLDFVLEDVATNIRQRRQRTRNHMKKNKCKKYTPIAHGLTVKAWNNIWASISNPTYQEKSNKCKVAANARTERMGYTHRLGSLGVAGLIKKFEEEFHRVPTDDEVAIGKREGLRGLFDIIRNRYNKPAGDKGGVLRIDQAPAKTSGKKQSRTRPSQQTGDSDSARTSSDEEEEGETSKESSSSGSGSSSSEDSEASEDGDGEDVEVEDEGDEQGKEDERGTSDEGSSEDRD